VDELHLLFWLSIVPFATAWVGTAYGRALPAASYGVVALGAALAYFALVRAILRANSDDAGIATAVGKDIKGSFPDRLHSWFRAGVRQPVLAYTCYAAVSLLWFVPDRRLALERSSGPEA